MELRYFSSLSYESALGMQRLSLGNEVVAFRPEPVVTLGLRADESRDLLGTPIAPVLRVDRGGEATYHGPSQLVFFPSIHLPSWSIGAKDWIALLLRTTALALREQSYDCRVSLDDPGVFTNVGKVASIGLRISNGRSLHGLSLNIDECSTEFSSLRACGVTNRPVDWVRRLRPEVSFEDLAASWTQHLARSLVEAKRARESLTVTT